jgi:hypothetical protein
LKVAAHKGKPNDKIMAAIVLIEVATGCNSRPLSDTGYLSKLA